MALKAEQAEVLADHFRVRRDNILRTDDADAHRSQTVSQFGIVVGDGRALGHNHDDWRPIRGHAAGQGNSFSSALEVSKDLFLDAIVEGANGEIHLDLVGNDVALGSAMNRADGDYGRSLWGNLAADDRLDRHDVFGRHHHRVFACLRPRPMRTDATHGHIHGVRGGQRGAGDDADVAGFERGVVMQSDSVIGPAKAGVETVAEHGAGAMLSDSLYARFGRPDYAIALHDDASLEAGNVGVVSGPALAATNSVDVTMRGVGSHGARPEASKDPVVLSAEYIMAIQTIVSRQIRPQDPAVVTVGFIHGGTKRNIIPDEVKMGLTIRSFNDDVQKQILADLKRTAEGVAIAGGVPSDRMPVVFVSPESSPVMYNNPELADRL